MDIPRAMMWLELQLKPWLDSKPEHDRPALVVWDNMAAHVALQVQGIFKEKKIHMRTLPPNTTDLLQVMDLVINRAVKQVFRSANASYLYHQFLDWRLKAAALIAKRCPVPLFKPEPRKPADAVLLIHDVMTTTFALPKYALTIRKVFIEIGLQPTPQGEYLQWRPKITTGKKEKKSILKSLFWTHEKDIKLKSDDGIETLTRRTGWTAEQLAGLQTSTAYVLEKGGRS